MGKATPNTAKSGKRKATRSSPESEEPAPKQSRLASLIAQAISQDKEVLEEIKSLLVSPVQLPHKPDGTSTSTTSSEQSVDLENDDSTSMLSTSTFGDGVSTSSDCDISLGVFSCVHPPMEQNIINKIVNGEYVDFPSLIHKDHGHETTTVHKTQTTTITSTHKASRKQLTSINQWNSVFQIFADIFTTKYPIQAPQLFRYMTIIQNLAKTTRNWLIYDEKFRRLRAACPSIPWGTVHIGTFLFCTTLSQGQSTTLSQGQPFRTNTQPASHFRSFPNRSPNSPFFRRGYCWDFQQVGTCEKPRCTKLHQCGSCEGPHGACQCTYSNNRRNNFPGRFPPKPPTNGKPATQQQQPHQQK